MYEDKQTGIERAGSEVSFEVRGSTPDKRLTVEMIDSAAQARGMDPSDYVLEVMRDHLEESSE